MPFPHIPTHNVENPVFRSRSMQLCDHKASSQQDTNTHTPSLSLSLSLFSLQSYINPLFLRTTPPHYPILPSL